MVSSVFAEDETAHEVSRYQLATMTDYVTKHSARGHQNRSGGREVIRSAKA
jgi:hypothetical protein